jgi:hypothetical protein
MQPEDVMYVFTPASMAPAPSPDSTPNTTIHPPVKIQQQLVKDPLKEGAVGFAPHPFLNFVHTPAGPGVHRGD